jgi:hypothetical protein
MTRVFFIILCWLGLHLHSNAKNNKVFCIVSIEQDSLPKDSVPTSKKHNPKLATKRSAILPGWGQIYNKQTWKVPIIYSALGITAYIFADNLKTYKDIQFAYNARFRAQAPTLDSSGLSKIKPYLLPLSLDGLAINRKRFRQQVDYSVLFFVAFWGLNVVDATVFGHLKNFDVSDKITGTLRLGNNALANNTGLSLSFDVHKKKQTKIIVLP